MDDSADLVERSVTAVVDFARENGGRQQATVIASDLRLPAGHAAFVNVATPRCGNYDDYTDWGHHRGVTSSGSRIGTSLPSWVSSLARRELRASPGCLAGRSHTR